MDFYIQKLEKLYSEHAETEYAMWSKKYMRNQFDFLGIRTPIRRKLTKQFLQEYGLPSKENLETVILTLWEKPEREYQKAALDILEKTKKDLTPADMPWLVSLLKSKSWWDTIDVLSPHIFGYMFLQYPELVSSYPDQWIDDDYIWLQRSAILYQLYYKENMNEKRLHNYILRQAHSNEFFVQKAIGWVLREYAKTNASSVQLFVAQNQLKPLSKREALKHLS
ncbi:DNA alkylation repair protein [Peribacillus sp. JNUCC 23]